MGRNDKCISICRLEFIPTGQANVRNQPGDFTIEVRGEFTEIPIASGEFTETNEQGHVEQKLQAVVTDTSYVTLTFLRKLFAQDGLLLLTGINGERKLMGTDQFPVHVNYELGGSPATLTLSVARRSPEPAKKFSSF